MDSNSKKAGPVKVLVLEDEDSMNRGISFSLERNGFEPIQAYTLKEAREKLLKSQAEIYICDITLPDGSGLDFVKEIRASAERQPYIICLTALDTEADHVIGYEAGADDYIAKPFSLSVLMLKLEAYVKRKMQTMEQVASEDKSCLLVSDDVCLDTERMEATVNGHAVSLTKNELKLLSVFMHNPQQLLSRKQLLEQAFDLYEKYVDENTLAVNIRRLREKLGDSAQDPRYIKNVRGLGYIWLKK